MKKPISKTKHIYLLLILIYAGDNLFAQQQLGAKLTALGMNSAAVKDAWSMEGNVAGISGLKAPQLALNYTKYPNNVDWSNQAAVFILPIKHSFIGSSFQRFGIDEYNTIKIGIALAKKFGSELTIGIKSNYHQLQIKGYGNATSFSIDVGAIYEPNERLTFGIYVNNPSFEKFNNKSIQIKVPSSICMGTAYQVSDKILIATSINKVIDGSISTSIGIDYQLLKQVNFRGGLTTQPFKEYAGFGLNYKNIIFDFAVQSDSNLGIIPQIGVAYAF